MSVPRRFRFESLRFAAQRFRSRRTFRRRNETHLDRRKFTVKKFFLEKKEEKFLFFYFFSIRAKHFLIWECNRLIELMFYKRTESPLSPNWSLLFPFFSNREPFLNAIGRSGLWDRNSLSLQACEIIRDRKVKEKAKEKRHLRKRKRKVKRKRKKVCKKEQKQRSRVKVHLFSKIRRKFEETEKKQRKDLTFVSLSGFPISNRRSVRR